MLSPFLYIFGKRHEADEQPARQDVALLSQLVLSNTGFDSSRSSATVVLMPGPIPEFKLQALEQAMSILRPPSPPSSAGVSDRVSLAANEFWPL